MSNGGERAFGLRTMPRLVLAFALAVAFVPAAPHTAFAQEPASDAAYVPIEQLLAAGDFVEGEAVAIVRGSGAADVSAQATELAEVDTDAVELAIEGIQGSAAAGEAVDALVEEAALRVQSEPADDYTVQLVVDHARTTEQILRELYEDPDVISAEPNYVTSADDAFGEYALEAAADDAAQTAAAAAAADAQVADEPASPQAAQMLTAAGSGEVGSALGAQADPVANPSDLSGYQWGMDSSVATYKTPLSPTATYSMNVPGWAAGRTDTGAAANASGTVCVMDTGVDYTHPDIKDVYYRFSEQQQAKYGCGEYGYNASGDELGVRNQHTVHEHGTHVAGIVAAQWDGYGVSGVAHGIKIFSVNVFGGNGQQMEMASVVKGFEFLADVSKEINLKAVNCSWGMKQAQFSLAVVINNLGKRGVNTVIAAGNSHDNLDETIDVSCFVDSPYVITVDAAMPNGQATDFSSYGQMSTDVFAPGAQIMSTVPQNVKIMSGDSVYSYGDFARFYPEATAAENLDSDIEKFAGASSSVRFFAANPAIAGTASSEIQAAIKTGDGFGYDDDSSAEVEIGSSLVKPVERGGRVAGYGGDVYMAIPVASAADAKWVGMTCAIDNAYKPASSLAALTFANAEGKPVEVDATYDNALKKGHAAGANFNFYWCQWTAVSYNVDGFRDSANAAHEIIARGNEEEISDNDLEGKDDPGQIGDLYVWKDNGKGYLIARVHFSTAGPADPGTHLLVDNVAVGKAGAFTGAFVNMPGTSMAAPAVAGCLAIVAKDEPANSTLDDAALEFEGRERAAKLLATVEYDDALSTLCRTGGRVNFDKNPGFAKKAPLIYRASSSHSTLTVEGSFFGNTAGTLTVDGAEVSVSKWTDGSITAELPASLGNGSHLVFIQNGDGAVSRTLFAHQADDAGASGTPLYENDLRLPTDSKVFAQQDRLWGPMVACDGSLYVMAATLTHHMPQGLWRFDTATGMWSSCALPEGYLIDDPDFKGEQQYSECDMVSCNGYLYLRGTQFEPAIDSDGMRFFDDKGATLWRYDPRTGKWDSTGWKIPAAASMCALPDGILFVQGKYFGIAVSGAKIDTFDEDSVGPIEYTKLDVKTGKFTALEGEPINSDSNVSLVSRKLVATSDCIYYYAVAESTNDSSTKTVFKRLTYNAAENLITAVDLSSAFDAVAAPLASSKEAEAIKAHFALTALPDGVAIVGSKVPGADTNIIYDDSTKAVAYGRTSCYHSVFDPFAGYCDGKLYAGGWNATETDAMYFRSTAVGHDWKVSYAWSDDGTSCTATRSWNGSDGVVHSQSKKASVSVAVAKAPTCAAKGENICVATFAGEGFTTQVKRVSVPDLPGIAKGKKATVGGNTYKVTSNVSDTVTLTKAKAAATVKVPKTVKIDKKTYKVTAIGASAFAAAKAKVKKVSVGASVKTIGKKAFANCKALAKVTGGAAVTTIGTSAFSGCKVLAACSPLSSKALKKLGASALRSCAKLKTITVKSAALTKAGVKKSLKGSRVATVKVKVDTAAINKAYAKKYAKFFAKANAGRKATVK